MRPETSPIVRPPLPDGARHNPTKVLPLAALMLAGSLGSPLHALAQSDEHTLRTVTVKDTQESPTLAKESLLVKQTGIAKGQQQIRDIPQTVTVMTEKLMDERNFDDIREVLKATSGVTFQAGETGEEDVRMRGFSLGQAGDIYVDGLRDAPLIERDTFNLDRVEILKGSASMLFGKGSTGGVVNQVSKQPFLMEQHEVNTTVGTGQMLRVTGDFNKPLDDSSAVRLNVMTHQADNWGAKVNKQGFAPTYRWHIGERNEYSLGFYHLQTDARPLYNHPWVIDNGTIVPTLDARHYYGLSSDYLRTQTDYASFSHKHRLDANSTLKTTLRQGRYSRDLWASSIGFCNSNSTSGNASAWAQAAACPGQGTISSLAQVNDSTVLTRNGKGRRGLSNLTQAQVEYDNQFTAWGHAHELLAGIDLVREGADRNNNVGGAPLYTATSSNSVTLDPAYTTRVGTPNDGESRVDTRSIAMNTFRTRTFGLYAQDMLHLNAQFKLVGGLRFDRFLGNYRDTSSNSLNLGENLWSPRLGAIWQPNEAASYYLSYGTSYNTSGDTYQYGTVNLGLSGANATLANTPPEKSRNLEVGGKWDVFDKRALLGIAMFRSEKYNERNTDVDTVANQYLLSGKRHASGMEFNFAGRLTPVWEMFFNHTWIPFARIDTSSQALSSNGNGAQVEGDRPALTPKHSASLWTTYRVAPLWRVGTGLNYRGAQNPDQQRAYTADAFTTADAMVEHTLSDNTVVKLNVTNLTNKLYADQLYRSFYVPGASRRLELSVKALF